MITTVLFDMGGTLEDIFVDEASEREAVEKLAEILKSCGLDPQVDRLEALWGLPGLLRCGAEACGDLVRLCADGFRLPQRDAGTPL